MPKRRYSLRDKLVTLTQATKFVEVRGRPKMVPRYTQADIAGKLGVSTRTIRRWKNEGVRPAEYRPEILAAEKRLQREFERERKRVAAEAGRDRRAHPNAPRLEKKLRVLPEGHRRQLKVYERGRDTGRTRSSEWINYDVRAWNVREIFDVVKALRDEGRIIQLVYKIPKGARYPRDARGRPGKVVTKTTRTGSPPLDLSNLDDGELMDFLLQYVDAEKGPKARSLVYVSALDQKRGQ